MSARPEPNRRGRPPKFGCRGQVVAITLPEDVVSGLRKLHPDIARAIVGLFGNLSPARNASRPADAELVAVGGGRSLIVVSREPFHDLPGVTFIPLDDERAFLALEAGRGMSDLELVVIDRLAAASLGGRERQALEGLRRLLRQSRGDKALRCETRAIIVLERVNGSARRRRTARPRARHVRA